MNTLELNHITGCVGHENRRASGDRDPEREPVWWKRESRVKNEQVAYCRRSQWVLLAACCLWLAAPSAARGQLVMHFSSSTVISPGSPSMTLSVQNSDLFNPVSIGGVNFFVKVQAEGPTMSTTSGVGVDLLTGTLFSGVTTFGQLPNGVPTSLSQGWGVLAFPTAASLGAGQTKQLATITFSSFPAGDWSVDFADPTVGITSFSDAIGNDITVNHLLGTVTVVPEPQTYALVVGFGLVAFTLVRRFRHHCC